MSDSSDGARTVTRTVEDVRKKQATKVVNKSTGFLGQALRGMKAEEKRRQDVMKKY